MRLIKRTFIIVLVLIMTAMAGCQQASLPVSDSNVREIKPLTIEEKLEDFEYLYKVIEENHPFLELNKRVNGIDWIANKKFYISIINAAITEKQYKDAIDKILYDLNNGHTNIISKDFYKYMKQALDPKMIMWKPWFEQLNMESALLRYSGQRDEKASASNKNMITPDNVKTDLLVENKVAYLGIKTLNGLNIDGDMKVIKPFLKGIRNYDALVIDIRGNGGGSSYYWSNHLVPMLINKPLVWNTYFVYRGGAFSEKFLRAVYEENFDKLKPIQEFTKERLVYAPPEIEREFKYYIKNEEVIKPKDSTGFKGKIYLLVDSQVYSSSEMFATFAKNTGFATLVGETTGGDGIGHDPLLCTLPNSGYVFRFPVVMGLTADGSCNEERKTEPDVSLPAAKSSIISKDKCIEYVINLHK